jgi:TrmH family RNA methyltransferase
VERIESARNERLSRARRLLSGRRARASLGLFVTEGEDLLEAALAAGVDPVDVLVDEEAVPPAIDLDRLGRRVALAPRALLAPIGTLGHAARVIATFRVHDLPAMPAAPTPVALELHGVGDPGNVGTLVRSVAALGPGVVHLGPGCADPLGPKAVRASMGAVFAVPVGAVSEGAADGRRRVALDASGRPLTDEPLDGAVTFLLGAERDGLPADVLAGADAVCRIPQESAVDSLNVAMAGTVALWEARRRRL